MSEKIKIKISEDAYYRLTDILKDGAKYSCIRFGYKDGCCGSTKAEIYLDNIKSGDVKDYIDELPIVYDLPVLENIREIIVVYRNGSFMLKTKMVNEEIRNCSSCTKGCGGKGNSSGGCSGCKKDG